MGIEKLRFVLAAICTLPVPPLGASCIDQVTISALNGDIGPGETHERARPLLITESDRALKGEGSTVGGVGEIEGLTSRDRDAAENDVLAVLHAGGGLSGVGEGTASVGGRLDTGAGGHDCCGRGYSRGAQDGGRSHNTRNGGSSRNTGDSGSAGRDGK